MVKGGMDMGVKRYLRYLVLCAIFISLMLITTKRTQAQDGPTGFDFRIEWEHLEEQSKDRREVDVSQLGARVGFSIPQTVDLYTTLSWQDLNAKFVETTGTVTRDIDPALAFKIGAKVYVIRDIPMGVPSDFTLAVSYSTARHKEDQTGLKFTHRRIIGQGGLEWRLDRAIPYFNLGILYSELDSNQDYDQTSLLIATGVYFTVVENVSIRTELNYCQEIGYVLGLQYMF